MPIAWYGDLVRYYSNFNNLKFYIQISVGIIIYIGMESTKLKILLGAKNSGPESISINYLDFLKFEH